VRTLLIRISISQDIFCIEEKGSEGLNILVAAPRYQHAGLRRLVQCRFGSAEATDDASENKRKQPARGVKDMLDQPTMAVLQEIASRL
jgi:hypothetical protein